MVSIQEMSRPRVWVGGFRPALFWVTSTGSHPKTELHGLPPSPLSVGVGNKPRVSVHFSTTCSSRLKATTSAGDVRLIFSHPRFSLSLPTFYLPP